MQGLDVWEINKAFLIQQKHKVLKFSHAIETATGAFGDEIRFLKEMGVLNV